MKKTWNEPKLTELSTEMTQHRHRSPKPPKANKPMPVNSGGGWEGSGSCSGSDYV